MEPVMDVGWMTHEKDRLSKHGSWNSSPSPATHDPSPPSHPLESATPSKINGKTASPKSSRASSPTRSTTAPASTQSPTGAKTSSPQTSGRGRGDSSDSTPNGSPLQRRGSWFSNISSKFSASPTNNTQQHAAPKAETDDVAPLPKILPNKNAVLPHASRQVGDAPYIPAPPKSTQPGFLGVFRRMSSSGNIAPGFRTNHGLVERKVLNVDKNRERPRVNELCQAKLRRVSFCVDVEIAPMPRYTEETGGCKRSANKTEKRKMSEKSEGLALRNPKAVEEEKETIGVVVGTGEKLPKEPKVEGTEKDQVDKRDGANATCDAPSGEKDMTRKKEKKKKSEAERKAKKEQKRREALEKGAIPMEIHLDSDSSTEDNPTPTGTPRIQTRPTTNPGRIYRRCCQLRETDILTKITSQLPKSTDACTDGIVERLDLTGYFMSLPDLVTLGDFLAVLPIRELILENCGVTDEGIRVILAGLLAAKRPDAGHRKHTQPADITPQGGVVERLVLKNNKISTEGWKHICLFIHMCRSIKCLDLSSLTFPPPTEHAKPQNHHHLLHHTSSNGQRPLAPIDMSLLLSKSLGERLAGSELELLNLGAAGLTSNQLGAVVDGLVKSGVCRLGLSHNNIDIQGVEHVARYLRNTKCEGIDLGGNDLRDHLETIAEAIDGGGPLWAVSLANCNLKPASLCKLFPTLVKLPNLKFIDLSHNHDLFEADPSAIGILRRYLPKMACLKRLHLADVSMSSEQAIALAEVLPEVKTLAHIILLHNPKLIELADATTEDLREEACALYASLLSAVRVSRSLMKVDIDNPNAESGELVKAMANRMVAYCMRNMQGVPDIQEPWNETADKIDKYPDVLRHLVGHEEDSPAEEEDGEEDIAPDDDYVIGGTGVVKALACVLKNRGDDSRRLSADLLGEIENGVTMSGDRVQSGKAKDMSKHLLATARKIRTRLQPALASAKASSKQDMNKYNRLVFLDTTIQGIIRRFEDQFPETRQELPIEIPARGRTPPPTAPELGTSLSSVEVEPALASSDVEDAETEIRSVSRSPSQSVMSDTSRAFAKEEGLTLRLGHKFRWSFVTPGQFSFINSPEELGNDPSHTRMVAGLMEDLMEDDADIRRRVAEKGALRAFQEDKDDIWRRLRDKDPQYWDRFLESQEKARANIRVDTNGPASASTTTTQQKPERRRRRRRQVDGNDGDSTVAIGADGGGDDDDGDDDDDDDNEEAIAD